MVINKLFYGRAMRIIMIASGDLWAGAEVMVYQLACGLAARTDLDLVVVLLNKGRLMEDLRAAGVKVHVVDETEHSFISLTHAVKELVSEFSPDIIHSHRYKENLLAWLVALGSRGIRLVSTQHGMPEVAGSRPGFGKRLRTNIFFRLLSCCFDRTVVVSREMQQALVGSYGFTAKDIIVIHNGIEIPQDVTCRSEGRIVVGSAGRLFPVKDFSLLVDIARYVIKQSHAFDFVLAGDGPEHEQLEAKVREYGIQDRFSFLGHVSDMDTFYQGLDIYINTSVHEGIPMSVLEAMSFALPVVVPKVGGFPEIVEQGVSGFLVEGRNPEKFAEKILSLTDIGRRRLMATAARQRVLDCFSREAMTRAYYSLYQEVVGT